MASGRLSGLPVVPTLPGPSGPTRGLTGADRGEFSLGTPAVRGDARRGGRSGLARWPMAYLFSCLDIEIKV